jgi:hypothetical protein
MASERGGTMEVIPGRLALLPLGVILSHPEETLFPGLLRAATPNQWQSRELPPATAREMWADIASSERFRRTWHARLKRLGLGVMADLHVHGDGATWIWRSSDCALTGCRQTLDIYHGCECIAKGDKELYGEGSPTADTFLVRGRELLLSEGWLCFAC